jgi:hypothetical protein
MLHRERREREVKSEENVKSEPIRATRLLRRYSSPLQKKPYLQKMNKSNGDTCNIGTQRLLVPPCTGRDKLECVRTQGRLALRHCGIPRRIKE